MGEIKTRYIITGAAGHLASTILRILQNNPDCEAYCLLLPHEHPIINDPKFKYFTGDICDIDSLRCLFENAAGKDVYVIHTAALITIAKQLPPKLYDINVGGVKNVVKLCEEYHVKRLVQVSSVHAITELPKGQVIREPQAFNPELVSGGYAKTKAEAAQYVLDETKHGLNAVVVFPSGIIGPYDSGNNHMVQMIIGYLKGSLTACVKGGYDVVDVRDVAQGCLLAAHAGISGESYILSGRYVTLKTLLDTTGDIVGKRHIPALPIWLARIGVPFIRLHTKIHKQRPLYTAYSLETVMTNSNFSNEKAKKQLNYTVHELKDTLKDMIEWLRNQKVI